MFTKHMMLQNFPPLKFSHLHAISTYVGMYILGIYNYVKPCMYYDNHAIMIIVITTLICSRVLLL